MIPNTSLTYHITYEINAAYLLLGFLLTINTFLVGNCSYIILKLKKSTPLLLLTANTISIFGHIFRNWKTWSRHDATIRWFWLSPYCYTDNFTNRGLFGSDGKGRQHSTEILWCTSIINHLTTKYKALLLTYLGFFLYKTLNSQFHFSVYNNKGSRVFSVIDKAQFSSSSLSCY